MADTSTVTISGIAMSDGTRVTFPALEYFTLKSSGNVAISSPTGAKINIESSDNIQVKPTGKVQYQTELYDAGKKDEFKVSITDGEKDHVEGLHMEVAGLKFESVSAYTTDGWTKGEFPIYFKQETGDTDTWSKVKMHGASYDIRTRTLSAGTGGGIALQPGSCDSERHENKIKIETDRKKDVFEGLPTYAKPAGGDTKVVTNWSEFYTGEGGEGIEIATLNSQFDSMYTAEMRRGAGTRLYAVTRRGPAMHYSLTASIAVTTIEGKTDTVDEVYKIDTKYYKGKKCLDKNELSSFTLPTDAKLDKWDYATQDDDSKDIKDAAQAYATGAATSSVTVWADLINAAIYLKQKGLIPATGATSATFTTSDIPDKSKLVYYTANNILDLE